MNQATQIEPESLGYRMAMLEQLAPKLYLLAHGMTPEQRRTRMFFVLDRDDPMAAQFKVPGTPGRIVIGAMENTLELRKMIAEWNAGIESADEVPAETLHDESINVLVVAGWGSTISPLDLPRKLSALDFIGSAKRGSALSAAGARAIARRRRGLSRALGPRRGRSPRRTRRPCRTRTSGSRGGSGTRSRGRTLRAFGASWSGPSASAQS